MKKMLLLFFVSLSIGTVSFAQTASKTNKILTKQSVQPTPEQVKKAKEQAIKAKEEKRRIKKLPVSDPHKEIILQPLKIN